MKCENFVNIFIYQWFSLVCGQNSKKALLRNSLDFIYSTSKFRSKEFMKEIDFSTWWIK